MPEAAPALVAHFETDAAGTPIFTEGPGHRHYRIVMELKDPPAGTYAATFELDPSYYNPVRTLRPDADGTFRLKLNTFGDYPVKVKMRTTAGEVPVVASLYDALQNAHPADATNPAVAEALNYIAAN